MRKKQGKGQWALGYYAGYQAALDEAMETLRERQEFYPEKVFRPAPIGEPYGSPDAAAAAMARFTCDRAWHELMCLKNAMFAAIGSSLEFVSAANRFTWKAPKDSSDG